MMFTRFLHSFDWFFDAAGEAWCEKSWRRRTIACVLILAAFLLRIVWYRGQAILARDEIFYLQLAGMPILDFPATHLHPPLLVWLLRFMNSAGLSIETCRILLGCVSGLAFLLGCYLAALELSERYVTALTALALAAVIPAQVRYTFMILRENLSISLYVWFSYFCIGWLKRDFSPKWMTAASFCGVLAVFCRYEAAELLILLWTSALFLLFLHRKDLPERRTLCIGFGTSIAADLLLVGLLLQAPGGHFYIQRLGSLIRHYVPIAF